MDLNCVWLGYATWAAHMVGSSLRFIPWTDWAFGAAVPCYMRPVTHGHGGCTPKMLPSGAGGTTTPTPPIGGGLGNVYSVNVVIRARHHVTPGAPCQSLVGMRIEGVSPEGAIPSFLHGQCNTRLGPVQVGCRQSRPPRPPRPWRSISSHQYLEPVGYASGILRTR